MKLISLPSLKQNQKAMKNSKQIASVGGSIINGLIDSFVFEAGISEDKDSVSISAEKFGGGKYKDESIKINKGKIGCYTDKVKDYGIFSFSSSERQICPWEDGVEVEYSTNYAKSFVPIEVSTDGFFVGISGHAHIPGLGGSFKIGFMIYWDEAE